MSIHIEVDTATISLSLGKRETRWYGPAQIEMGEAFFDQADSFPSYIRYKPSAAFYEVTDRPLSEVLEDERLDPYLEAYQAKYGTPADRPDLVCVRYAPQTGDPEALMHVDVFLAAPKFELLNRHLERLQTQPAGIVFSAQFLGFQTDRYDEKIFPTLADFQAGHPYITYDNLEFAIRSRVA
jgi:hypothetical protein